MRALLFLLIIPLLGHAEEYQWKPVCDQDMRSITICSGEKYRFYDDILNQLYQQQMEYLQTETRKELLREAQLSWIEFRDKDCTYSIGKREDSGSIWRASYTSCLTDRTMARIKDLKQFVGCRDNGCAY